MKILESLTAEQSESKVALEAGQAVVVVHPLDGTQRAQAVAQFQAMGSSRSPPFERVLNLQRRTAC